MYSLLHFEGQARHMRYTRLTSFFQLFVILIFPSLLLGGQIDAQIGQLQLLSIQKKQWLITGQVKSLRGEPVSNAKVLVHLASVGQPNNTLTADVQGKYSMIVELEAHTNQTLTVMVPAEKVGFATARETANFTKIGETWPIDLVMRPAEEDSSEEIG